MKAKKDINVSLPGDIRKNRAAAAVTAAVLAIAAAASPAAAATHEGEALGYGSYGLEFTPEPDKATGLPSIETMILGGNGNQAWRWETGSGLDFSRDFYIELGDKTLWYVSADRDITVRYGSATGAYKNVHLEAGKLYLTGWMTYTGTTPTGDDTEDWSKTVISDIKMIGDGKAILGGGTSGVITADQIDAGGLKVNGNAEVTGNTGTGSLTVHGDAAVGGNETVNGGLTVGGDSGLKGNAEVGKDLTVDGNTNLKGNADVGKDLTVEGTGSFGGGLSTDQNVSAKGDGNVGGNLTVGGDSGLKGNAEVGKDLTVEGNTNLKGNAEVGKDLTVGGTGSFGGGLSTDQNVSAKGDGDVGGNLTVGGDSGLKGNAEVGKDLTVEGNTNLRGNAEIGKDLTAGGTGSFGGDLGTNGNFVSAGNGTFGGDLRVKGGALIGGGAGIGGSLAVAGDIASGGSGFFGNTLTVGTDPERSTVIDGRAGTVSVGSKLRFDGMTGRVTGVAPGRIASGSTDAVNGAQVYDVREKLNRRIDTVNDEVVKVGAGAAALAALHPQDYDENHKFSLAAGLGHYGSREGVAVGAFLRPTPNLLLSAAYASASVSTHMVNLGVSYRFGGYAPKPESFAQMQGTIADQAAEIRDLNARLSALQTINEELREEMHDIRTALSLDPRSR